jgi:hypothetical protein
MPPSECGKIFITPTNFKLSLQQDNPFATVPSTYGITSRKIKNSMFARYPCEYEKYKE